jgi:hypothetical protein
MMLEGFPFINTPYEHTLTLQAKFGNKKYHQNWWTEISQLTETHFTKNLKYPTLYLFPSEDSTRQCTVVMQLND